MILFHLYAVITHTISPFTNVIFLHKYCRVSAVHHFDTTVTLKTGGEVQ